MPTQRPNIIYVLSDEHRGQSMSHMGDPNVSTPVLDRLAAEGVSFSRAYANCPVCTPSRGTIFSGRHAHAGPVQSFWDVYKPAAPSTAHELRRAGYSTCYVGKWHPGVVRDQVPPALRERPDNPERINYSSMRRTPEDLRGGFEDWFAFETSSGIFDPRYFHKNEINPRQLHGYTTDAFTDLAIEYLEEYASDKPLFMVLSVVPPHFPLVVPDKWKRLDPEKVQLRPNVPESSDIPHSVARFPDLRERMAAYFGMIENLDWNIGRLIDAIDTIPFFDNTLVVYISDHGEFLGSHGRIERKELPHEESIRIPGIFRWKDVIPAQGARPELFSLVDLQKTVLGLAGMRAPQFDQGFDCSGIILNSSSTPGQDKLLIEMHGSPRWILDEPDWRAVLTKDWKYVFFDNGKELLFDLGNDPYELDDLSQTTRDRVEAMKSMLLAELERTREPYFDVLIRNGETPDGPVIDVSAI